MIVLDFEQLHSQALKLEYKLLQLHTKLKFDDPQAKRLQNLIYKAGFRAQRRQRLITETNKRIVENKKGVGRPVLDPIDKRKLVSFKLPPALIQTMKKTSKKEGIKQTQLIELAISYYCKQTDIFK